MGNEGLSSLHWLYYIITEYISVIPRFIRGIQAFSFLLIRRLSRLNCGKQGKIIVSIQNDEGVAPILGNKKAWIPWTSHGMTPSVVIGLSYFKVLILIPLILTDSAFAATPLKDTAPVPAFVFISHLIAYPYLVGAMLLVEWPFFKWITRFSWIKALFPLLVTTFITFVISALVVPFVAETFHLIQSSMYHRVSRTVDEFNPLGWSLSFLFLTTFLSFIKMTVLYLSFRSAVRWSIRNFWLIYAATVASAALVLAHMVFV